MLGITVPAIPGFETDSAAALADRLKGLRTLEDVGLWDAAATDELRRIDAALRTLGHRSSALETELEAARRNHEAKSLLARFFSGRSLERQTERALADLVERTEQLGDLKSQIESAIDFTPDSAADAKELVKECRLRKKELQAEKRAVAADMAAVRVDSRQRTAHTIPGKYGKWDRRSIRWQKEASLKPHELQKSALERQLVSLDRMIVWLERFK